MDISQFQWQTADMNKYNMFISEFPHTTELKNATAEQMNRQ